MTQGRSGACNDKCQQQQLAQRLLKLYTGGFSHYETQEASHPKGCRLKSKSAVVCCAVTFTMV